MLRVCLYLLGSHEVNHLHVLNLRQTLTLKTAYLVGVDVGAIFKQLALEYQPLP